MWGDGCVKKEREGRVRQGETEKQKEESTEGGRKRRNSGRKGHARRATPLWVHS